MKLNQNNWFFIPFIITSLISFTLAQHSCNETTQCPESEPCCSQYGVCGTGAYCLGGCDIRYSYNLSSCMPMPRMFDFETTFTSTDIVEKQTEYLGNSSESDWVYTGYIDIHNDALLLQMPNETTGTVLSSTKYLWYGKVSATLRSSHDRGVVTAFILFSDVQDEIDYEFVGYNLTHPQSNYYAQGILDYDNAKNSSTSNTFSNYHTYELDWREDKIDWYLDGEKVRTLERNSTWNSTTKRYDFPQTPSRIQMSLWPGGDTSNAIGTIEWAGGVIDWNSDDIKRYGYYYAYLKNVTVSTYDLPSGLKLEGSDRESDLHAFLYNSTDGNADNIYLTNKKTWLGSDEATGFDPQNDDDETNDTTTKESSTGSKKTSGTTTSTKQTQNTHKTANVPTSARTTTTSTDDTYNTSGVIGGFVQNTRATSSPDGSNPRTSSNDASSYKFDGIIGLISLVILGSFSLI